MTIGSQNKLLMLKKREVLKSPGVVDISIQVAHQFTGQSNILKIHPIREYVASTVLRL